MFKLAYIRPRYLDQTGKDYLAHFYVGSSYATRVKNGRYTLEQAIYRIDDRVTDVDLPEIIRLIEVWMGRREDRKSHGRKIHRASRLERCDHGKRVVRRGNSMA